MFQSIFIHIYIYINTCIYTIKTNCLIESLDKKLINAELALLLNETCDEHVSVKIEKGAFYNLSGTETGTSILQQGSAET